MNNEVHLAATAPKDRPILAWFEGACRWWAIQHKSNLWYFADTEVTISAAGPFTHWREMPPPPTEDA